MKSSEILKISWNLYFGVYFGIAYNCLKLQFTNYVSATQKNNWTDLGSVFGEIKLHTYLNLCIV